MKIKLFALIFIFKFLFTSAFAQNDLYEKIDLFGEVIENIKKEYVDDVDQSEMMDSAINGVLQSLDPYSLIWAQNYLRKCKQILKVNLED